MKPEYDSKSTDDPELAKELTLQVRKVIGPFAAPKKIVSLVSYFSTEKCIYSSSHLP
jgi:acyl-coenzyme A synthetase/AMP-(fatty) acid ligase